MSSLFILLCVSFALSNTARTRLRRTCTEEDVEEQIEEGYQLLKTEPHAAETREFLEKLQSMNDEITDELSLSPQQQADLSNAMKNYVDVEISHVQPMGDTIDEINENNNVEMALYQGDMILTEEQGEEILEDIRENNGELRSKRQAYRNWRYPRTLWSDGVYYSFYNATDNAKRVFKKAAEAWQEATCIDFKEDNSAKDKINVIYGSGCYSSVGRIGGNQTLSLGKGCETVGTALHEIGHALGMYHTQCRHDRDDFIIIQEKNVRNGWMSQLTKESKDKNYNYELSYDYGKCDNVCPTKCQNGGFPHPRNCSKCICPSGYGGDFCNERPSGCGEILNATTSYQTLTVTLGNPRSRQAKDVGEVCNYWIQGPTRSRIEVVLESYEGRVTSDGCVYAGVEIKTREDKRQTGYKFCSKNNSRTTLVSTYNVVPLTVYNRLLSNTVVVKYRINSTQSGIPHSTTETSSCLTFNPPTFTSRRTRATTTIPKSTPKTRCREQTVCPMLVKTGFCTDPKYDVITIKMVCPASCGYC